MKPNFFIIGAMKSGTTSLHHYLSHVSAISMSEPKEINFFSNPRYWKKGFQWYERHFRMQTPLRGESSTSYSVFPETDSVAKRIHEYCPEAKVIYLVREPVSRLVSHYIHNCSEGRETLRFDELALSLIKTSKGKRSPYITRGLYYSQLEQYLEYFDSDRIHVTTSETLRSEPRKCISQMLKFLGTEEELPPEAFEKHHNSSKEMHFQRNLLTNFVYPKWMQTHPRLPWILKSPFYRLAKLTTQPHPRPELTSELKLQLYDLFSDDVNKLEKYLGRSLKEWQHLAPTA